MEKSQVNEKYVLTLVENSDATLSVRRMDIPSSEVPIAELEAMVDNPNRTIYDMSSYFYSVFSPKIKAFAFCYPSEYNRSYIDKRSAPEEVSYADYVKAIKEIKTTFNAKHRFSKETKEALELKLDKEIKETDHSAKEKYLKKASIYIKCLRLSETVKKIKEHDEIKQDKDGRRAYRIHDTRYGQRESFKSQREIHKQQGETPKHQGDDES